LCIRGTETPLFSPFSPFSPPSSSTAKRMSGKLCPVLSFLRMLRPGFRKRKATGMVFSDQASRGNGDSCPPLFSPLSLSRLPDGKPVSLLKAREVKRRGDEQDPLFFLSSPFPLLARCGGEEEKNQACANGPCYTAAPVPPSHLSLHAFLPSPIAFAPPHPPLHAHSLSPSPRSQLPSYAHLLRSPLPTTYSYFSSIISPTSAISSFFLFSRSFSPFFHLLLLVFHFCDVADLSFPSQGASSSELVDFLLVVAALFFFSPSFFPAKTVPRNGPPNTRQRR